MHNSMKVIILYAITKIAVMKAEDELGCDPNPLQSSEESRQ